jgi:hypothetical protein
MEGKKRRLSRLQRIIIEELCKEPNKVARIAGFSMKVADRYSPEKLLWREYGSFSPRGKMLGTVRLGGAFSVSFSRAIRSLELKGLVELVHGTPAVREIRINGVLVIQEITRVHPPHGKVTLIIHHDSPLFRTGNLNT